MLDVGRLRVLLAISEYGSLPAAARAVATPAADAATQLSALERELGLTLVESDRLTPAGQRLAAHASRVLAEFEAAEADAAAVAHRAAGVLRLGVGATAGRALLPETLAVLRSTAPELDVRVEQLAEERSCALGADRLDVAVLGQYAAAVPRRVGSEVDRWELLTEPLLVAVPVRHRIGDTTIRLSELADERWIGGDAGSDALVALERAAAAVGFEPVVVANAGEAALALALVAAGHGLALVPASAVPGPVHGVRFMTAVDGGLRRTVVALVRRSSAADPAIQRVLDALTRAARRVAAAVPGVTASSPASHPGGEPYPRSPAPAPDRPGRSVGSMGSMGSMGSAGSIGSVGSAADLPPRRPDPPPRRPDPLSDPLPSLMGDLPVREPSGDGIAGAAPFAAGPGDVPGPRRESADDLWGDRGGAPRPGGGRSDPDPRRDPWADPRPEPWADHGDPYRSGPADRPDPWPDRAPSQPPRNGVLPPPGAPRPRSGFGGSGSSAGRPPATPPEVGVPYPTSPDLGVRSLTSAELPTPRPEGWSPSRRRVDPAELAPDALPPAPPGAADDVRLSIFEDLRSEWFTQHDGDAAASPSWRTPADDGWQAAARLTDPTTAGTTTAGLPKRKPQALYVPGAVANGDATPNGAPSRSPQEVRGRLSSYRDGVRRGRHAEHPDGRPDQR